MGTLARKIIDAIQNIFLDLLIIRVWPILLVFQAIGRETGRRFYLDFELGVFALAVAMAAFAWLLGFAARHRRRSGQAVLARVQDTHRNSFEVWSDLPEGGLKPPAFLRNIVLALGRPHPERRSRTRQALDFAMLAVFLVSYFAIFFPGFGARISPILVRPDIRMAGMWGLLAWVSAGAIMAWASDSRLRLLGKPIVRSA